MATRTPSAACVAVALAPSVALPGAVVTAVGESAPDAASVTEPGTEATPASEEDADPAAEQETAIVAAESFVSAAEPAAVPEAENRNSADGESAADPLSAITPGDDPLAVLVVNSMACDRVMACAMPHPLYLSPFSDALSVVADKVANATL